MPIMILTDAKGQRHRVNSCKIISRKAVYGIYLKNDEILMVKDKISKNWEFPGGGVKDEESPLQALKREFFEETGLTILDNKIFPSRIIYSCIELFFDTTSHEAWKTKRDFFLISQVEGKFNKEGNNEDVIKTQFFSLGNLPFSGVSYTIQQVLNKFLKLYKEGRISKINP